LNRICLASDICAYLIFATIIFFFVLRTNARITPLQAVLR
jgi:hypothetical protein